MKKLVAILLAMVLTLGACVTAFAANDLVNISKNFTAAGQAGVDKLKADTAGVAKGAGIADDVASKLSIYDVFDISLKNGENSASTASPSATADTAATASLVADAAAPGTVTFNVPGVTAKSEVYVLHYDEQKGVWENVTTVKGNGTVTAEFKSFSPAAILIDKNTLDKNTAAASNDSAANASSVSGKSPKTGEAPYMAVMCAIAAVAVVGIAVSRKKYA